jgi:hypothetical protein
MRSSQTDGRQRTGDARSDGWNPELSDLSRDPGTADGPTDEDRSELPEPAYETSARRRDAMGSAERGEAASSWQDIKSRFVDDPAGALEAAEALVQAAVDRKVRALKEEVAAMCERERGEDAASTEDLRTRLIRYQAYCDRLSRMS